jgi:hypothetical protein
MTPTVVLKGGGLAASSSSLASVMSSTDVTTDVPAIGGGKSTDADCFGSCIQAPCGRSEMNQRTTNVNGDKMSVLTRKIIARRKIRLVWRYVCKIQRTSVTTETHRPSDRRFTLLASVCAATTTRRAHDDHHDDDQQARAGADDHVQQPAWLQQAARIDGVALVRRFG